MKLSKQIQFLLFLLIGFLFLLQGYRYGAWEQTFYIPVIHHLLDPAYLKNDWFVTLVPYHTNVLYLLVLIGKLLSLPGAFLLLQLVSISCYVVFTFYIARELVKDDTSALIATYLLCVIIPYGLGGYFILQNCFTPIMLGNALLLISVWCFLRERYVAAFLFTGFCAKAHLLIGLNWLFILAPYYAFMNFTARSRDRKQILLVVALVLLFFVPDLLVQFFSLIHTSGGVVLKDIFFKINVAVRYPHHYLLSYNGLGSIVYAAAAVVCIYAWRRLVPKRQVDQKIRYIIAMVGVFCLINFLCVDLLHVVFIAKLQLLRITYLIQYFFLIYFTAYLIGRLQKLCYGHSVLLALLGVAPIFVRNFPQNYLIFTGIWAVILVLFVVAQQGLLQIRSKGLSMHELVRWLLTVMICVSLYVLIVQPLSFMFTFKDHERTSWTEVCRWVRTNTPTDAVFITPPYFDGFRMYAERATVVDLKACPYQEKDILSYAERMTAVTGTAPWSWGARSWALLPVLQERYAALSQQQLLKAAYEYDAAYVIRPSSTPLSWPRLYMGRDYSVYVIPR